MDTEILPQMDSAIHFSGMDADLDTTMDNITRNINLEQLEMDLRNNPLLANVQQALCKQLLERKEELEERLRDKQAEFKVASKRREDAGVKLYGLQKTLATLHTTLSSEEQTLASTAAEHNKVDQQLSDLQKTCTEKRSETEFLKTKLEKSQHEFDKISLTLKEIESYNEDMKGEIAVTRRITYSTEEHIVKAEKEKKKQDMLIANLQHQIKQQLQKQAICKAQLAEQEKAEVQTATLKKLDGQIKLLQKQVQQTVAKRVKSLEEYGKLLVSLEEKDAQREKLKSEKVAIEEKVKASEQFILEAENFRTLV